MPVAYWGLLTIGLLAQEPPVVYDVAFPNIAHHEAEITVTFGGVPPGTLEVRMSRSSPGRYALHEFARNVYRVRAEDGAGRTLPIARPDPYQWDIAGHDGTVVVHYTLFADRAGGTYSQFDPTHAHMNMPATFMWARGFRARPIAIAFHPPRGSGWKAATQLVPTDRPMAFTAPNLDYFMDSPTELSDHTVRTWSVPAPGGGSYEMRLSVHHLGTDAEVDDYAAMARRVVAEEIAVFGEPAPYDHGTYTFIADYLPYASGDGMEHRNSTVLTSQGSLARNAMGLLGTISHEFFHSWNVERIRPSTLEPFDFERANMSRELWFAEGFTSYYTPLFIRRAGLSDNARFAQSFQGRLDAVVNGPGRRFFSPVEMSMQAPFVDAATAIDPTNFANTFISYYTWGAMVGLNLDLTLRTTHATSLDTFMRFVWHRFGKPEMSYDVDGLEQALADFTHDPAFAQDFFARFVRGREVPDYAALLAKAGFLVRRRNAGQAVLGVARLDFDERGAVLRSGTRIGLPLYDAGLDRGDRLVRIDTQAMTSRDAFDRAIHAHRPGETVTIDYVSRGGKEETVVATLIEDPRLEVVPFETAGREVTPAVRAFRADWLGSRAANRGRTERGRTP